MQATISDLKAEQLFFTCLQATIPRQSKLPSPETDGKFTDERQKEFFTCVQLGLRAQDLAYRAFVSAVQEQKKSK